MIGYFVNTVVLRTTIGRDPQFQEVLNSVRTTVTEAMNHIDVPYDRVARETKLSTDGQMMFAFHELPHTQFQSDGLVIDPLDATPSTVKFDMDISLHRSSNGEILGKLIFNGSKYTLETMRELVRQLEGLARRIIESPNQRISQLVTSESEHSTWDGTDWDESDWAD